MSLLDAVLTKLQTDPARWPDRRGDYHADCPYCQKPAKKGQTHFCISAGGLCYCQVCQQGTTLTALATHLGVKTTNNGQLPQVEYDYYDASGVLAYQVVRFYKKGEKSFFQRHPDEHGQMVNGMNGVERVLYRLPELTQAVAKGERVYIVEGEKDAEILRMRGLVATTNVGGAGKWQPGYSEALKDADVVILPDNDQIGDSHAQQVRQSLQGIAKSARIVRLPGLSDKGDVSDWLAMGHTLAELNALIEEKAKPIELVTTDKRRDGVTLFDLQYKEFPPERWIIEGILPEGACLFAAKYKSKKSWLSLALGLAIAMGGRAIGRLLVEQGDVLYLDLEGRQQRIQKRTRAMLGVRQVTWPNNFHVYTQWAQADEGLADLEHWLMAHPKAALIIIDVLASFRRPMNKQEEFYRYDRDTVDPINALAEKYHVAIILVHHFNKGKHDDIMDSITGSSGLPSAVNTMWALRRDVNDSSIQVLELRGRDLENDEPLALKWDTYLNQHIIEGPAAEVAISTERKTILAALADDESHTPKDIATTLGRPVETVKQLLRKLLNEGVIDKVGYGKYARISKGDHSDHGGNFDHSDHSDHSAKSDRESPRVIGNIDTDHSSDHSCLEQQDALNEGSKTKSDRSDGYSKGPALESPDNHPLFANVPSTERQSLRVRLRGSRESDQEVARERCQIYGVDYDAALAYVRSLP